MIVIISPLHHFLLLYHALCFRIYLKRMPATSVLCLVWTVLGETHLSTKEACSYHWSALSLSLCLWFVFTYYLFFINIKKMLLSFIKHVWKFKKYWNAQKIYIFIIFMILNLRSPCMSQTQSSPCQSNLSTNRTWTTSPRAWPASPRRIQHLGWLLTRS